VRNRSSLILLALLTACSFSRVSSPTPGRSSPGALTPLAGHSETALPSLPRVERWGIYRLHLDSQEVELLYSSPTELSYLDLNDAGDRFAFSQRVGGEADIHEEIFTLATDGEQLERVTQNEFWDLYPVWSPDDSRIAFLSQRDDSLGVFVMDSDGSNPTVILDSPSNEADIDWVEDQIAFTRDSRIWIMRDDGSDVRPLTNPPRAGDWGAANLPFGDYDPRISPDGSKVVFERLVGDQSPHGNYDLFVADLAAPEAVPLTHSGYSQGLASWSHSGNQLVYIVAAIGQTGQYDLFLMNADGTDNRNINPDYFPPEFLCRWAVFSKDDSSIFFIGEWWSEP
jgi:Tol biopolymer transport system component